MNKYFKKISIVYVIALIILSLLIGFSINFFISKTLISTNEKKLIGTAESFEKRYIKAKDSFFFDVNFKDEIETLEEYSNASFWIVDNKGYIYVDNNTSKKLVDSAITINDVKEVFEGKKIIKQGVISEISMDKMLILGYPITYNNRVDYALFLHISIPEVLSLKNNINKIVVIALIITSIFGLSLLIFFSKKLLKEIIELNDMVSYISKGNFDKRIDIKKYSDLKILSSNINNMAIRLNIADENKKKFISNITHDLRSPLTNIIGYSKGMLDGTINEGLYNKYLNVILEESIRLKKLVNDILDLSKLESGIIELNKTTFDINQIILSVIENYENLINKNNIEIKIIFSEENKYAYADSEYIKRVLDNLISNAVKFTPKGGYINISTIYEFNKYSVIINNSFEKIDKSDLVNVFDRFVKLDGSRGKEKISSGLGLSIVKEILKVHGEKIYVTSDDSGVTFKFTISVKK